MTTCKGCTTRHPHCHSECAKYQEWTKQNEARKAYEREYAKIGGYLAEDSAAHAKRRARKLGKRF